MRTPPPLRAELASVLRFLAARRSAAIIYPTPWPPQEGVLAELAAQRSPR